VKISLVAAVARGGVIGRDNAIPWYLPEDARRFRAVTMGHPVVMGRRTWDSLPPRFRPLPGRRNIVVSRNPDLHADGAERAESLDDALRLLEGEPQVFVVGGAGLYADALALADELLITQVDAEVQGDVFFPTWDRAAFREESREPRVSEDGVEFAFVRYVRRGQAEA
jgi:dihydrofolate reductase